MNIIVVGGGWAGCAAALAAKDAGADRVVVLERTDMLLGTGLVGGIFRNNGRFTAAEEMIALGGGELFDLMDQTSRHQNIEFPGHKHASLYDVARMEPVVKQALLDKGIEVYLSTRVKGVVGDNHRIKAVVTDDGESFEGDVFVEATGTSGPPGNCSKYGNGCAMCILRCHSFGPRISVAAKMGTKEFMGRKADGTYGAMSGSCKLLKESLSEAIQAQLNRTGVSVVPIPSHLQKGEDSLSKKACQQYALKEFAENIILLDTGHAKLMTPFYPLALLRQVPGFETARFEDPYSGGMGNSMRYLALSPRDNYLKVEGVDNLFCGGEKAGLLVGHTEAAVTGALAGHNAARFAAGKNLLELPSELAVGDAIAHVNDQMKIPEGLTQKYTFSGSVYFKRMQEKGLYSTDIGAIRQRVEKTGLSGVFAKAVV